MREKYLTYSLLVQRVAFFTGDIKIMHCSPLIQRKHKCKPVIQKKLKCKPGVIQRKLKCKPVIKESTSVKQWFKESCGVHQ